MSTVQPSKRVYFQVLSTGVKDVVPSLLLITDHKRYLFNCGEGIQRLLSQRKVGLSKLNNFFITRHAWSHTGGFPGIALTMRDMKVSLYENVLEQLEEKKERDRIQNEKKEKKRKEKLLLASNNSPVPDKPTLHTSPNNSQDSNRQKTGKENTNAKTDTKNNDIDKSLYHLHLHAPPGAHKLLKGMKHFLTVDIDPVKLNTNECTEEEVVVDDAEITLTCVPIYDPSFLDVQQSKLKPNSDNLISTMHLTSAVTSPCLAFIGQLKGLRGKFLAKKALELGVPRADNHRLVSGETLTLSNGSVVHPSDVLEEGTPGSVFVIVDASTESHIANLCSNERINQHLQEKEGLKSPVAVISFVKKSFIELPVYQQWLKSFPSTCEHICMDEISERFGEMVVYSAQYLMQCKLHQIHPKIFPMIEPIAHEKKALVDLQDNEKNTNSLEYFSALELRSTTGVINNSSTNEVIIPALEDDEESLESIQNNEGPSCKKLKLNSQEPMEVHAELSSKIFPSVLFLGTGAAIPSKYRNVSSTLVHMSDELSVLLDCGEGTYGQLCRHYGHKTDEIMKKIKIIFVSHMHADHHLGLISLLNAHHLLQLDTTDPPIIVAPSRFLKWLQKYAVVGDSLHFRFVANDRIKQMQLVGDVEMMAVPVQHPSSAYGLVMHTGGVKVTYSGDTMPCRALIQAGRGSTLLIHEATLDDELEHEAVMRQHSTTSQAIEVGRMMQAKHTLLTHFSQRYPKIPKFNEALHNTAIAFDHMEISVDEIPRFGELLLSLCQLFSDEEEKNGKHSSPRIDII